MTQKEQTRLQVLNSVLADQVPVCQAAEVLGVSERHIERRRQSSQASGIATQETHAATEGPVEGRAAG